MKNKRPVLDKSITLLDFKQFYWEKIELIAFCRANVLTTQGSKLELEARIELFLTSGEKKPSFLKKPRKGQWDSEKFSLTRDTMVINYKSDPITRAFFSQRNWRSLSL